MNKILNVFYYVCTSFLLAVVYGNIYFPELYEDDLYKPSNFGPFPMSYQTTSRGNTTIVQWTVNDDHLVAVAAFSEDSGPTNCLFGRLNFKDLKDECKTVQSAVLLEDFNYIVSVHCKSRNRVLLVQLVDNCNVLDKKTTWELVYTSFDNKRELK